MLREIALLVLPALLLVVLPPTVVDTAASAAECLLVGVLVVPALFLLVPVVFFDPALFLSAPVVLFDPALFLSAPVAVLDPALLPQASLEDFVADVRLAVDPVMLAFVDLRLPCAASPLPTIGRQRDSEKSDWIEAAAAHPYQSRSLW